jgi:hypothetical protein
MLEIQDVGIDSGQQSEERVFVMVLGGSSDHRVREPRVSSRRRDARLVKTID